MAAPPLEAGPPKAMLAWVSPALAVPIDGAPGTTAVTGKVWDAGAAALPAASSAWPAATGQLPALTKVSARPELMVHTPVVEELNVGASGEVAVADRVGAVPKFCAPGLAKVIVWLAFGVTALEAPEATLVPT